MSTHRARIRPDAPRVQHYTHGVNFEKDKGWYPVSAELAAYLAGQPLHEGNPSGPKLFDAGTVEFAAEIDKRERRTRVGGAGSARNPVDPATGQAGIEPDEAEELRGELAAARAENADIRGKLDAILAKLGMGAPAVEPVAPLAEAEPAAEAQPPKKPRPGAASKAAAPPAEPPAAPAEPPAAAS